MCVGCDLTSPTQSQADILIVDQCVYRSLDNRSNQIRWSLDLRWQRPDLPNGFYGLKDCITMAKSDDPNFKVSPAVPVYASGHPVIGGNMDSLLGCMCLVPQRSSQKGQ